MPDERDRRRVLVWLTEAGREALASARSVLSPDLLAPAFERVAPADRASLIENMQALVEGSTRRSDR
ncbi:MAG: DUF2284 domain-containing protein, partial [Planctomycetota bacterium]|jgi:DNA-binding MarR family transcriptional regulator